ncbi:hypothetical protein, partial [Bradyrhizobium macuxiense]|uniref:hypothetical protein n=1 Tax=Bradyrhizobium macuxiense TaxID=1755647 RepID=UPI001ABF602A
GSSPVGCSDTLFRLEQRGALVETFASDLACFANQPSKFPQAPATIAKTTAARAQTTADPCPMSDGGATTSGSKHARCLLRANSFQSGSEA